jgi:hypothetical protein
MMDAKVGDLVGFRTLLQLQPYKALCDLTNYSLLAEQKAEGGAVVAILVQWAGHRLFEKKQRVVGTAELTKHPVNEPPGSRNLVRNLHLRNKEEVLPMNQPFGGVAADDAETKRHPLRQRLKLSMAFL